MELRFIVLLIVIGLFACRKDEVTIKEHVGVTVIYKEDVFMQIKDPQLILIENSLKFINEGDTIFIIDLGDNPLKIGYNQPVRVKLPFGYCDDKNFHCTENISMNISSYSKIDELVTGEIVGKLYIEDKLQDVEIRFNVPLTDEFQKICGRIWYDLNKNNLLDHDENGINGMTVEIKANGIQIDRKYTGPKSFQPFIDGYFELNASTKYTNDVIINIPQIGFIMVEPTSGNGSLAGSAFDQNGQILGLIVKKGEKIVVNGGLREQ